MARKKGGSDRDRFESLLHNHLRHRAASTPPLIANNHLDDDTLTAFTEGRLNQPESTPIISHLIDCTLCRRATAELIQLAEDLGENAREAAIVPQSEPGRIRRLLESLAARLTVSDEAAVAAYGEQTDKGDSADEVDAEKKKTQQNSDAETK